MDMVIKNVEAAIQDDIPVDLNAEVRSKIEAAIEQAIAAGAYLATRQYHVALAGNISARVSPDLLICTRHGADKEFLTRDDFVLCNSHGQKIEGAGKPTSELNMHRAAYDSRPDIHAVIHSHPPAATAFAATGTPLDELQLPEMLVLLGPVAMVPYRTPGSSDLARELTTLLRGHDAFLLQNHGTLTLGHSVRQAALRTDLLEQKARVTLMVKQLGQPFELAVAGREVLMGFREQMADWGCEPFPHTKPK
jgi:L-fuculose-phosphate aldolase